MSSQFTLLGLLGLLAAAPVARAQTPANLFTVRASTYQAEYDSLRLRSARVRAHTDSIVSGFQTHFAGLGGTCRRVRGFAPPQAVVLPMTGERQYRHVLVKRQITKHKTHNAEIEKVFYYSTTRRLLLYEYYEQHQLVQAVLQEFPKRAGREYGAPYRTTRWVRGDYLHLTIRPRPLQLSSASLQYYFTAPRPLN